MTGRTAAAPAGRAGRRPRRAGPSAREARLEPHHSDFERNCLLKYSWLQRWQAEGFCRAMAARGVYVEPYRCRHCGNWHTTKEGGL